MKIALLSNSDFHGGASIAATSLASSLSLYYPDQFLGLFVSRSSHKYNFVQSLTRYKFFSLARSFLSQSLLRLMMYDTPHLQSLSLLPSGIPSYFSGFDNIVYHLHWINGEFLSIEDLSRFRSPIVWTLHDCWPFLGTEHHDYQGSADRFFLPLDSMTKPPNLRGLDLSYMTWKRKSLVFRHLDLAVICPSQWMKEKAAKSLLFADKPLFVIPNAIDTDVFRPHDRFSSRQMLGLPIDKFIVMLCVYGNDYFDLKGSSIACEILTSLMNVTPRVHFLLVGSSGDHFASLDPLRVTFVDHVSSSELMALYYSSSDILLATSRFENLPTVCIEAQACSLPVFAFNVGGTSDTLLNLSTGFLAPPFDTKLLIDAILSYIFFGKIGPNFFSASLCRRFALSTFSPRVVSEKHMQIYRSLF